MVSSTVIKRSNLKSIICLHTVKWLNSSISIITGTTTLDQREPGRNDNEEVLHIPPTFRTEASPSDGLVSYSEHSLDAVSVLYSANQLNCYFSGIEMSFPGEKKTKHLNIIIEF